MKTQTQFLVLLTGGLLMVPVQLPAATEVLAVTGQASPDANGTLQAFGPPVVNSGGQVAFKAELSGTSGGFMDDEYVLLWDESSLGGALREGDGVPDENGSFGTIFEEVGLSDEGRVLVRCLVTGASGGRTAGVYLSAVGGGDPTELVRKGDDLDGPEFNEFLSAQISQTGQVAVLARFVNPTGRGVFAIDPGSPPVPVAVTGQPTPGDNGTFSSFPLSPSLGPLGAIAFSSSLSGTMGGSSDDVGIYIGGVGFPVEVVAREGLPSGGNGSFGSELGNPSLNANAQMAFFTRFMSGTSGGFADNIALYRVDNAFTTFVEIARKGNRPPDGNGLFSDFRDPALNDLGQMAFVADLFATAGSFRDNRGIFLAPGGPIPILLQVARKGQLTPNATRVFEALDDPALNTKGQVAFHGTDSSGADGIYLYDLGLGLLEVARVGSPLLGSTISGLSLGPDGDTHGNERQWLNDEGQVVFRFRLADDREGVALWTLDRIQFESVEVSGDDVTMTFKGDPGQDDWRILGGSSPNDLTEDRTNDADITDLGDGRYRARLPLEGSGDQYFFRVQR